MHEAGGRDDPKAPPSTGRGNVSWLGCVCSQVVCASWVQGAWLRANKRLRFYMGLPSVCQPQLAFRSSLHRPPHVLPVGLLYMYILTRSTITLQGTCSLNLVVGEAAAGCASITVALHALPTNRLAVSAERTRTKAIPARLNSWQC